MNNEIKKYLNILNKKFPNQNKIKLEYIVIKLKRGNIIPKNNLVIMPSSNSQIYLKILENDTVDKGFSIPLIITDEWIKNGITPNYLSWYLNNDFVKEYLSKFAKGSLFIRIPKDIILSLLIPIPPNSIKYSLSSEILINNEKNPFRELINKLYKDY